MPTKMLFTTKYLKERMVLWRGRKQHTSCLIVNKAAMGEILHWLFI